MTKKEKLEYFKLVEPKLREKFYNKTLTESDFDALNIKGKDAELFKDKYFDYWIEKSFDLSFDADFWNSIDSSEGNSLKLDFPDDKYFYQFGVPNLDIRKLKDLLNNKTRIIIINCATGGIEPVSNFSFNETPKVKSVQNHIQLIIDNPFTFLEQLKNGELEKILSNDRKHPIEWVVPNNHPLAKAMNPFLLDDFIEVLSDNQQWINYRFFSEMFFSFEDLSSLKFANIGIFKAYYEGLDGKVEMKLLKDVNTRPMNDFFFKVENPLKMRFELMNGNMEVMNEIKEVNFCSIFDPRKNGV